MSTTPLRTEPIVAAALSTHDFSGGASFFAVLSPVVVGAVEVAVVVVEVVLVGDMPARNPTAIANTTTMVTQRRADLT
jgi:hypothetical protein